MLLPSIFGENLFDDFFDDVPFFDNRAENQIEKKLYGRHAHNVMKTDIKETDDGYELIEWSRKKYAEQCTGGASCIRGNAWHHNF